MKIYIKSICLIILLSIFLKSVEAICISNLNNYRFFLRISELYDIESKYLWEKIIDDKQNIIEYINKNNKQDQYREYVNKTKNNKLIREKRRYINKLNNSIENKNIHKIKRYLKLILNIFEREHYEIKKLFNIQF